MVMKLESMSKNIVSILESLSKNEELRRVLALDVKNPYDRSNPSPTAKELLKEGGANQRLFPYPFDLEATTLEGSFIRVYYNDFDFNSNEVIMESELHIDIIVSKSLWTINNGKESFIRPYDLASRVISLVGRRSVGAHRKIEFTGGTHMYVNTKFDCIRLYAKYFTPVDSGH